MRIRSLRQARCRLTTGSRPQSRLRAAEMCDQRPRPWGPEEPAALREQLIPDLAQLTSEDDTADWSTRTCRRRIRLSLQTPTSWRRGSARGLRSSSNSLRNPRNRARQVTKPPSPEVGLLSSLPLKTTPLRQSLCLKSSPSVVVARRRKPSVCATRSTASLSPPSLARLRPHANRGPSYPLCPATGARS